MKTINYITLTLLLPLVFLLLPFTPVEAGKNGEAERIEVKEVRYRSNPDYTRIVIDLSDSTSYKYHHLKEDPSINKPPRLFIDFSNTVRGADLRKSVTINDGLLKSMRTGQYNSDTVRVVLDFESVGDFTVFPLEEPFRLVIDVKSKGSVVTPTPPKQRAESPLPLRKPTAGISRIVIDAGHGGKDPGAIGNRGLKEKDVNLKIAKKLKQALGKHFKGQVVLTRDKDVFLRLEDRTAIANAKKADLFLSIHTNASRNKKARGVETYYLNYTTDEESIRLAARENATSTKQISDLQFILNDLMSTSKTNDSARLAASIQDSLVTKLRKRYRRVNGNGIKGAPFYVLVGTHMPSILVEVSFISNREEETRLRTDAYLNGIVQGITAGVIDYINGNGVHTL